MKTIRRRKKKTKMLPLLVRLPGARTALVAHHRIIMLLRAESAGKGLLDNKSHKTST
jgi:hypothetical protein